MSRSSGPIRSVTGRENRDSSVPNAFISQSGTREADNVADAFGIMGNANAASTSLVLIENASHGQSSTYTVPDIGAATGFLDLSLSASSSTAPDVIVRYITAGQAALASAGKVVVQPHTSATSQFAILGMRVIKSTGLSGNSGDRLLGLSDGTIVYNSTGVTAALLGTPITTRPAGTGNPDCATSVNPTASTAGADIFVQYTGGTTDYNAGSVLVEVTLAQVTA